MRGELKGYLTLGIVIVVGVVLSFAAGGFNHGPAFRGADLTD